MAQFERALAHLKLSDLAGDGFRSLLEAQLTRHFVARQQSLAMRHHLGGAYRCAGLEPGEGPRRAAELLAQQPRRRLDACFLGVRATPGEE